MAKEKGFFATIAGMFGGKKKVSPEEMIDMLRKEQRTIEKARDELAYDSQMLDKKFQLNKRKALLAHEKGNRVALDEAASEFRILQVEERALKSRRAMITKTYEATRRSLAVLESRLPGGTLAACEKVQQLFQSPEFEEHVTDAQATNEDFQRWLDRFFAVEIEGTGDREALQDVDNSDFYSLIEGIAQAEKEGDEARLRELNDKLRSGGDKDTDDLGPLPELGLPE